MIFDEEAYYLKQLQIPFIKAKGQKKISKAKILVIGAGGLGSAVLPHLTGAGIGTIGICEFDQVSASNLHRQHLYSYDEIGDYKIEHAISKLERLNPQVIFKSFPFPLQLDNGKEMIKDFDLIIDCTDNLPSRFILHDLCLESKKNLLTGAVHQEEGTVSFFHFAEASSPCLRCLWGNLDKSYIHQSSAIISPLAGVIGSLMATEALKSVLGLATLLQGEMLQYDQASYQIERLHWGKSEACLCQAIGEHGLDQNK